MKDLYIQMCRGSPVQKDWKKKADDIIKPMIINDVKFTSILSENIDELSSPHNNVGHQKVLVWLPRQEDWQNLLHDYADKKLWKVSVHTLLEFFEDITGKEWNHEWVEHYTNQEHWTILWCLFVHREVYNLVWDWDKNAWEKP